MGCFRTGEHFYCDVHRLFHQLHIPPQEQVILWNMATKQMNCERFKNILLLLLNSRLWNELKTVTIKNKQL
jgi:hypothetical protein